jgi:hypothetical protein
MAQLGFDVTIGFGEQASTLLSGVLPYPSPTSEQLNVSGLEVGAGGTIQIMDMLGRQMTEPLRITSSTQRMQVDRLPAGSYFVRVSTPKGIRTGRFVKQ